MPFKVIRWTAVSRDEFVRFWVRRYRDPREALYEEHIGRPYRQDDVLALFEWKNGGKLSEKKRASVLQNYLERLPELDDLPSGLSPTAFLERWGDGGAIWRIFWMHCWQPRRFPIYDQHVHRAAARIEGWSRTELPASDPARVRSYVDHYLPFCREHGFSERDHDRALWAFGKYCKTEPRVSATRA